MTSKRRASRKYFASLLLSSVALAEERSCLTGATVSPFERYSNHLSTKPEWLIDVNFKTICHTDEANNHLGKKEFAVTLS